MSKFTEQDVEEAALELSILMRFPDLNDLRAWYVADDIYSGNQERALRVVIDILRQGKASPQIQSAAAYLLELSTAPKPKGRKSFKRPKQWGEIGADFSALQNEGKTWLEATEILEKKYNMSKSSIEDAVRFEKKVMNRFDQLYLEEKHLTK